MQDFARQVAQQQPMKYGFREGFLLDRIQCLQREVGQLEDSVKDLKQVLDCILAEAGAMTWREMSELPCDGDSVWLVIREWDQKNYHVDYAIVFFDVDGPIVKRYESDEYKHWPPNEAIAWMECSMPSVPPGTQRRLEP
jgi:hypothetical protein